MEEAINLISEGCQRAKILEASLPYMSNYQPHHLLSACTEIVKVFTNARERISKELQPTELLHANTPAVDLLRAQLLFEPAPPSLFPVDAKMKGVVIPDQEAAAAAAGPKRSLGIGGEVGVAASPSGPGGSSSQRQRRRSDGAAAWVKRVAAPQMGNTEIPPEDGYTWRKYGQKAIQHAKYPRSYFRCTHQKLYKCPARRKVQRLDDDPTIFEVTYLGNHTCHLSSTAPSGQPPPSSHPHQPLTESQQPQATIRHQPQHQITAAATTSVHLNFLPAPTDFPWLTMETNTARGRDPGDVGGQYIGPSVANINAVASGPADVAGPSTSTTPYAREHRQQEVEYNRQQPVADMADAMFKSGNISNDRMDLIFSSMVNKWDSGEKKN